MNINYLVFPEATGFLDGREWRGVVVATAKNKRATARCYLPDEFDEHLGKRLATLRLMVKLHVGKEKWYRKQARRIETDIKVLKERLVTKNVGVMRNKFEADGYAEAIRYLLDENNA